MTINHSSLLTFPSFLIILATPQLTYTKVFIPNAPPFHSLLRLPINVQIFIFSGSANQALFVERAEVLGDHNTVWNIETHRTLLTWTTSVFQGQLLCHTTLTTPSQESGKLVLLIWYTFGRWPTSWITTSSFSNTLTLEVGIWSLGWAGFFHNDVSTSSPCYDFISSNACDFHLFHFRELFWLKTYIPFNIDWTDQHKNKEIGIEKNPAPYSLSLCTV